MNCTAWVRTFAATLLILCSPLAFAAISPPWPEAPYSYYANNAKLETVLAEFAAGFSLSLAVQPDVGGVVNGRFATTTPTEFLTRLAGMYGFVWYTHAGTLFVSRSSDVVTQGIAAPGASVSNMRKALADLGVLEPRFGWGELGEQGVAMVSGPPSYVKLIESTIRNLPARAQQLMVFRLQHAAADDRIVHFRDQDIKTPGLASILRTMVAGSAVDNTGSSPSAGSVGVGLGVPMRQAAGLGDPPQAAAAVTTPIGYAGAGAHGPRPMIQAEPRVNAIIVQDLPERMPLYEQLIAQLDVPTAMVEIEAMIIDISTDRASELGVNWSGRIGRTSLGYGQPSTTPGVGTLSFSSGATAAGNFLISQLQLLESRGDAEIRSRPSVLTAENLAAVLDLSETFYIRTQGERVANVVPVTAGTTLRVSPHVLQHDGKTFVQLKIDIEDGKVTNQQVDGLPTVSRTSVSTEATVMQGESLLIAGYSSDSDTKSKDQVPVLGDIPVVGMLFSNKTRTRQKTERMFLIRPKVVGAAGPSAEQPPQ